MWATQYNVIVVLIRNLMKHLELHIGLISLTRCLYGFIYNFNEKSEVRMYISHLNVI